MHVGDVVTITPLDSRYSSPHDYIVSHVGNRWITLSNERGQECYSLDKQTERKGKDWTRYAGSSRKNSNYTTVQGLRSSEVEAYKRHVNLFSTLRELLTDLRNRVDMIDDQDASELVEILQRIVKSKQG